MPGLKTGVENAIFWSQIGSGFGEPGGTPHQQFPGVSPLPRPPPPTLFPLAPQENYW